MDKIEFGFDWILQDNKNRTAELCDFYKEGEWEIAYVKANIRMGYCDGREEWTTRYEVGNPLFGGIKNFSSFAKADKYFYELVGRVHMKALHQQAKAQRGE